MMILPSQILVAGIGNIFFGDDAFGVEVARELASRSCPEGMRVVDFGIRGFDLAFALMEPWDQVILVDAIPRGGPPGTLYVLEIDPLQTGGAQDPPMALSPHGMNPLAVLDLVHQLGGKPVFPILLVGCEPLTLGSEEEPVMALSPPVLTAVHEAISLIEKLASPAPVHELDICSTSRRPT